MQLAPLSLALWLGPAPACAQILSFQHVVTTVPEHRSPGNLIQGLRSTPCDSAPSCATQPTGNQFNIHTRKCLDNTACGTTEAGSVPLADDCGVKHPLTHGFDQAACA